MRPGAERQKLCNRSRERFLPERTELPSQAPALVPSTGQAGKPTGDGLGAGGGGWLTRQCRGPAGRMIARTDHAE